MKNNAAQPVRKDSGFFGRLTERMSAMAGWSVPRAKNPFDRKNAGKGGSGECAGKGVRAMMEYLGRCPMQLVRKVKDQLVVTSVKSIPVTTYEPRDRYGRKWLDGDK